MEIAQFAEYQNIEILGICLCVGYILKNVVTNKEINRYIPLLMGLLGLILSLIVSKSLFDIKVILTGLISGLAATGAHQAVTKITRQTKEKE